MTNVTPLKKAEADEKKLRYPIIHWAELERRGAPPYLVKGLLHQGAFSALYGPPGSMKTFIAIDLGCAIARKQERWHGHRINGGPVIYLAAEGGYSIETRLAAYCTHHKVERANVPFFVVPVPVDLGNPKRVHARILLDSIDDALEYVVAATDGEEIKLIVIDTVARSLFGKDENTSEGMGHFVAAVDMIRARTAAHVMAIHHPGKDPGQGLRGWSGLKGAVDTEILIEKRDGVAILTTSKQRDMDTNFGMAFKGVVVELDLTDDDGDPITSLALEPTEDRPVVPEELSPGAKAALDALWIEIRAGRGETPGSPVPKGLRAIREARWRELCAAVPLTTSKKAESVRKAFGRARKALADANRIVAAGEWIWPVPADRVGQLEVPF